MKKYDSDNIGELYGKLKKRSENISADILTSVSEIINGVRDSGDRALREYTKKFDGEDVDAFKLTDAEIDELIAKVPEKLRGVIGRAAENIGKYHAEQRGRGYVFEGNRGVMGQRVMPLDRVGLYVPGGTAAYPSTVLMNAIPAKLAGVRQLIMATPPKREGLNPAVVYAAKIAGVDEIYRIGGAQAIAALAYGTETVPAVDKIVGPGNIYVSAAKRLVYGLVDIDMIAGPSEILIIADASADPDFIAADLLSQAEHDKLASSILISTSPALSASVEASLERQLTNKTRAEIAKASVENYGAVINVANISEAVEIANMIAPEHLEIATAAPFDVLPMIKNAGSVFLGGYTPEPVGDYYAGPNHVLPTNGTARFSSPLSVDSFMKKSSFLYYNNEDLLAGADDIVEFAEAEGLTAHADAVRIRKNKLGGKGAV